MRLIEKINRFLYQTNRLRLILIVFFVYFLKTGIWYLPNIDGWWPMSTSTRSKTLLRDPLGQFVFWNWLGPFLAWLLHIHNRTSFMCTFALCFAIAFTLACFFITFFRLLCRGRRQICVSPPCRMDSQSCGHYWIGMDSMTHILMMFILNAAQYPVVCCPVPRRCSECSILSRLSSLSAPCFLPCS